LADAGWPVLCTIHQPSSILFEHFDQLLLLVRGGRTAYFGPIGQDARTMIDYFERHGGPVCSPAANPAEYILEVVGAGTAVTTQSKKDWADIWDESPEARTLKETLDQIHETANQHPTRKALTYASPLSSQFYYVLKRMSLAYWRSPDYNIGRFVTIMASSLITGFTYWKLSDSKSDLQNRLFALFSSFLMANILIIIAQPKFMTERIYFRREHASRFYSWIPFGVSAILVEIPYILFIAAWYMFAFYWTAGLVNTSETVGFFYLMSIFFVCWAVTLGFVIAAVAENPTIAAVTNPLIISILILFSGFMQPVSQMPKFWSSWVYWLNPFHYFIEGLTVNELSHIQVDCRDKDLLKFLPPPGETCASYTENFFSYGATGYISNPNATQPELCGYCAYKDGSEFYSTTFGWDYSHKYRNLGVVIAFFVFNIFTFTLLVWWKRKGTR
jgi:ABC-type multidrug transport system permease subunit